jgi:TPP-dependent pyruvate/acetoin dehydrogenase alpha subunit
MYAKSKGEAIRKLTQSGYLEDIKEARRLYKEAKDKIDRLRIALNEAQGWNWFEIETIPAEIQEMIEEAYKLTPPE